MTYHELTQLARKLVDREEDWHTPAEYEELVKRSIPLLSLADQFRLKSLPGGGNTLARDAISRVMERCESERASSSSSPNPAFPPALVRAGMAKATGYLPLSVSRQISQAMGYPAPFLLPITLSGWNVGTIAQAMITLIRIDEGRPYLLKNHMVGLRKLLTASGVPAAVVAECTAPAHNRLIFEQQVRRGERPDYKPTPYSQPITTATGTPDGDTEPAAYGGPTAGRQKVGAGMGRSKGYTPSGWKYDPSPALDFAPIDLEEAAAADIEYARTLYPGHLRDVGYPNHGPHRPQSQPQSRKPKPRHETRDPYDESQVTTEEDSDDPDYINIHDA
jgi:hypothetical protein